MILYLACAVIVIVAFGGEALFGFGGGLVAVPLLSLLIDVREAVVLVCVFQFFVGFLIFKNFRSVAWNLMPPVVFGLVGGVAVGSLALAYLDLNTLRIVLAVFILLFLAKTFFAPELSVRRPSRTAGAASGFCAGFFQGCLSTGGPNFIMYLKNLVPDRKVFRATMIFLLSLANLIRMPLAGFSGLFTPLVQSLTVWTFPAFIAAVVLGQRMHHKIPEQLYFRVVYFFLFLASISLLARSVVG